MRVAESDAFARLRDDWGGAYDITYHAGTVRPYRAERRDNGGVLYAGTPDDLRDEIRRDYLRNPVSRKVAP